MPTVASSASSTSPRVRSRAAARSAAVLQAVLSEDVQAVPEGLVYVTDTQPGIRRVRRAGNFHYQHHDGRRVTAAPVLERIRKLAIPPAYEDVWICPLPHGHLQATGRDARGRKQYRYHADWRTDRDAGKFEHMQEFGRLLPRLRRRLEQDLVAPPDERTLLVATVSRLLDATCARVGNDAYARENGSYGLTTLRRRHVQVRGCTLRLVFNGKSGVQHDLRIEDARLARIVQRCQELPGQSLFQYRDAEGRLHGVASDDVNRYLRTVASSACTAKDFRTWHASVLALETLRQSLRGSGERFTLRAMLAEVAAFLGNTPAVCRKSYVHPLVLALAQLATRDEDAARSMLERIATRAATQRQRGLLQPERRLLAFMADKSLQRQLEASGAFAVVAAQRA